MNRQPDWKAARCGVEVGVTWFRQYDADAYPRGYIGEAKGYQDEMLAAVSGLARTAKGSDMSVAPGALDEHWRAAEWERGA